MHRHSRGAPSNGKASGTERRQSFQDGALSPRRHSAESQRLPAHRSPPSEYDRDGDGALRNNQPQDIENRPDHGTRAGEHLSDPSKSRYWNDVSLAGWLRNGNATDKPGFDHSASAPRFNSQKGDVWHQRGRQDGERHGSLQDPYQARDRPKG
jgi:hypothetical protein